MVTRSLFSTPEELRRLSRTLTRLAVALSLVSVAIMSIAAFVTRDSSLLAQAVGPCLVAAALSVMVLLGRENAPVVFLICATSVVVSYRLVGTEATGLAATTAIVVMAMLGSLFVVRRTAIYVLIVAVVLIMTPAAWGSPTEEALAAGIVMAVSFAVGSVAILMIRAAAFEATERYREAFLSAPVPLVELEWSRPLSTLAQIADSPEGLERVLNDNPALVRDLAASVEIVRANTEAARVMGFGADANIEGRVTRGFLVDAFLPAWTEQLLALAGNEPSFEKEVVVDRFDDRRHVVVRSVSHQRSGSSTRSVVSFTDVTASRMLENNLKELIEAKDEFIASVSHELRTPLTAVLGLSEELGGSLAQFSKEETAELLNLISSQSREMAYIVEDLLVGARAENGTVTVRADQVNLEELTRRVVAELEFDCKIDSRLPTDWSAIGDRVRVRQIVRNLVLNAIRYGGSDRRVVLYQDGDQAVIEVRDSGDPLSASAATRIFSAYETAHQRTGITAAMGLGLSVSRSLARLMGGDLTYTHDGETVFRVTLPSRMADPVRETATTL